SSSTAARSALVLPGHPASGFAKNKCPAIPGGTGILADGDFSLAIDPGNTAPTFPKGSKFAPRWKVSKGEIDFNGTTFCGFSWYCSVDLDGIGTGGIKSKNFQVTAGTT